MPGMRLAAIVAVLVLTSPSALAHGIKPKEKQFPAGVPVPEQLHFQHVPLQISDAGWQGPALVFKQDASVVFVLTNTDTEKHLFVIGNPAGQRDQALMHSLMPADTYDYPNTRHLAPGQSAQLGWRFNRRGLFSIQCLVPGHENRGAALPVTVLGDH